MPDIALISTADGLDLDIAQGVIRLDGGLETSVLVSLGIENSSTGTGAFWGAVGDPALYGSKIHEITDTSTESVELLRSHTSDALMWMTDEGIADKITIEAMKTADTRVDIDIIIRQGSQEFRYGLYWESTERQLAGRN